MDTESGVAVRCRRNREEGEQLVIGYRSSQLPRKEYCRLHGIGLSTLDRYLHQWHRQRSDGGKEVPAEGRLVAVELAGAASVSAVPVPVRQVDTKPSEAGGLGPDNVLAQLDQINKVCSDDFPTWIDMETRVRVPDNSALDMAKVRSVLQLVKNSGWLQSQ